VNSFKPARHHRAGFCLRGRGFTSIARKQDTSRNGTVKSFFLKLQLFRPAYRAGRRLYALPGQNNYIYLSVTLDAILANLTVQ
jgi:hypothetical protein